MEETWMPVLGFEGFYEASSHGKVRSLDRVNHRGARIKGRILRSGWDGRYCVVSFCQDGLRTSRRVHQVVAEAFLGEQPEGLVTCHHDGDPRNNRITNLRFDTAQSNMADQIRHGRMNRPKRTHCKRGHEMTAENSYWSEANQNGRMVRRRTCLTCKRTIHNARRVAK